MMVGAGEPEMYMAHWRHRGELMLQLESDGRIISSSGTSVFRLRPSTDWVRPAHIMEQGIEDNLFSSNSTDLNVI